METSNEQKAAVLRRTEQLLQRGWVEGAWIKPKSSAGSETMRGLSRAHKNAAKRLNELSRDESRSLDESLPIAGEDDGMERQVAYEAGKLAVGGANEQAIQCCVEGAVCYAGGELGLGERETGELIDNLLNPVATKLYAGEVKRGRAAMSKNVREVADRYVERGTFTRERADEWVEEQRVWSDKTPLAALEINDAHKTSAPVLRIVREAINRLENEIEVTP